jgi:hypothetical protein
VDKDAKVARRRGSQPPECPGGWSTGLPDFVGVGAQRSGTSWWFTLLSAHPGIAWTDGMRKEVHFFDQLWDGRFSEAAVERYALMFPRFPGQLAGEWTPRYMYDVWAARLLRRAVPAAKLLVLLRDPVERFRSGVAFAGRRGGQDTRAVERADIATAAVARSRYFEQLERLLRFFPRDQLLVLQFERCRDEPERELARTYSFLGLEPVLPSADLLRPSRARGEYPPLDELIREEVLQSLRPDTEALLGAFPELDRTLWPNFR